jgi:cytidylate kinase
MYRAVTWAAIEQRIALDDEVGITRLAEALRIDVLKPSIDDGRQYTVLADGEDVTWQIRRPDVNAGVSPVSAYPGVRAALSAQQRRIGQRGQVVMVGRDIGTVVLPGADLKIYLDASVSERASRRYAENLARGKPEPYEDVLASLRNRDRIDSSRAVAPLRKADDAIAVDTTQLNVDEVVERILDLVVSFEGPR